MSFRSRSWRQERLLHGPSFEPTLRAPLIYVTQRLCVFQSFSFFALQEVSIAMEAGLTTLGAKCPVQDRPSVCRRAKLRGLWQSRTAKSERTVRLRFCRLTVPVRICSGHCIFWPECDTDCHGGCELSPNQRHMWLHAQSIQNHFCFTRVQPSHPRL